MSAQLKDQRDGRVREDSRAQGANLRTVESTNEMSRGRRIWLLIYQILTFPDVLRVGTPDQHRHTGEHPVV
jgi:hypothetical protein